MKIIKYSFLVCSIILCCFSFASADGFPLKNGRYSGRGSVLLFKLTQEQIMNVEKHYKPYLEIKLSKKQQTYISMNANFNNPPSKIIIVKAKDLEGQCTCGIRNIGILINEGTIEFPQAYLATDEEAEKSKIID
jgi:hypothetical protein